jgi:hypothetical protein
LESWDSVASAFGGQSSRGGPCFDVGCGYFDAGDYGSRWIGDDTGKVPRLT